MVGCASSIGLFPSSSCWRFGGRYLRLRQWLHLAAGRVVPREGCEALLSASTS